MDIISPASTPAHAARKVGIVRLLRLLALVAVVALVYFAQYLFDHGSLAEFYPDWLLTLVPSLRRSTRWLPTDLLVFAQWISVIGLLGYGLLSPMWTGETNRLYRRMRDSAGEQSKTWRWAAFVLVVAALSLAGGCLLVVARDVSEPVWLWGVWLGSMLAYVGAIYAASQAVPGVQYARRYLEHVYPWQNWQALIVLLVALALLYTYELRDLPARIDPVSAATGLHVRQWLQTGGASFFGATWGDPAAPGMALAALTTLASRDALLGVRLTGVIAGLMMVAGVWLVATELFRRAPHYGEFGEVLEDDGRWLAFMAAILTAVGVAVYYFTRMPVFVEVVGLGTLAIWALLRGLRTDRPWLLGVSGLGLGWTWYFGAPALIFAMTAATLWIGVMLLERGWLAGKALSVRGAAAVRVQRGAGWAGFGLWVVGIFVVIAPLAGQWLRAGGAVSDPLIWRPAGAFPALETAAVTPTLANLGTHLRWAIMGLNQLPDQSGLTNTNVPLLPGILAPLLVLAIGALLLNMDTLMGWVIITWLGSALAGAALTGPVQPFWPALLPILPAAGLALAFVMDRTRVLLMETLGTWTLQATVYLALGVAVAAGMLSWITFYEGAHNEPDLAGAVGRAAAASGSGVQLVVVNGQENLGLVLTQPVVRLVAGDEATAQAVHVQAGAWPERIPTPARMLVAPADAGLIPLLHVQYPDGEWQVWRSLNADPVLYIYDLPAAP